MVRSKEGVDGSSPSEGFENALKSPTLRYPNRKRLGRAGTRGLLLAFPRRSRDRTQFGLFQRDWTASDPLFTVA
jgi:hypothetical protein